MESEGIKTTEADNDARRSFFIVFKAPYGLKSIGAIGFSSSLFLNVPYQRSKHESSIHNYEDFTSIRSTSLK